MSRQRKTLDNQKGDLTIERQEEIALTERAVTTGAEQLQEPPLWLKDDRARNEWYRLLEQFEKINIISNLDYNNLGAYCNAFSGYVETTELLKGKSPLIKFKNKVGAENLVKNPLINVLMTYSDEMRKYSSLLGLSIDSRLKLADLKLKGQTNNIEEEFGDI